MTGPYSGRILRTAAAVLAFCLTWSPAKAALFRAAAQTESIQSALDAAAPGDTVLVPAGDYNRALFADKAVTVLGEGDRALVRVGGFHGSEASVSNLTLDGRLLAKPATLIEAGSRLVVSDCDLVSGIRGALIGDGAVGVLLRRCTFTSMVEAVYVSPLSVSSTLDHVTVDGCPLGLSSTGDPGCPQADRAPADRCASAGCPEVQISASLFRNCDVAVSVDAPLLVAFEGSRIEECGVGLALDGVRLEMTASTLVGSLYRGTGIQAASVSGYVHATVFRGWDTAIKASDGGCSLYTALTLGGSRDFACDFTASLHNLVVLQPEALAADYDWWGSVDCDQVARGISGQPVGRIVDEQHLAVYDCTTPVRRSTWGAVKTRYEASEERR